MPRVKNFLQAFDYVDKVSKDAIEEQIEKLLKSVTKTVERMTKSFLRRFSQTMLGVVSVPGLGAFTPRWAPLAEATVRKKRKSGFGRWANHFFRRTGELKTFFSGADTSTVLGTPLIAFRAGAGSNLVDARMGKGGVFFTDPAGGRGARRSSSEFFRKRKFSIVIRPFPILSAAENDYDAISMMKGIGHKRKEKLQNSSPWRTSSPFRNTVSPYARFWLNTTMVPALKETINALK